MKNLFLFGFFGLVMVINAQVPDAFSYQAVVRSNDNELLKNQIVTLKATILRNDEVIFTQTQTTTTNENGLLTIEIGNEGFQEINWLDGPLFIKTEIDPTGGNNFTIETETQLLTVPYAMAAKTAENVPELDFLIERIENLEAQLYFHYEIPFNEYSLDEIDCRWQNLNNDETTVFINCFEELENYIICIDDDFPEIDFSKYTLLLTSGRVTGSPPSILEIQLKRISFHESILFILVVPGVATTPDVWSLAIKVPKMTHNDNLTTIIKND